MCTFGYGLGLTGIWLVSAAMMHGAEAPKKAEDGPKVVKYSQLGDLIRKNRGKVVVVDFWNIY